jgi:hypothetical protein
VRFVRAEPNSLAGELSAAVAEASA